MCLCTVNVAATLVSTFTVDLFGRKFLFTEGGLQMAVCMTIIAAVLGTEYGKHPNGRLPQPVSRGLLAVFCTFAAGYAWSFGPLPWLLPSGEKILILCKAPALKPTIYAVPYFASPRALLGLSCATGCTYLIPIAKNVCTACTVLPVRYILQWLADHRLPA